MHECMYVWNDLLICEYLWFVFVCICMFVCIYVWIVYVIVYAWVNEYLHLRMYVRVYLCIFAGMCVCTCVCMCVYVCVYVCIICAGPLLWNCLPARILSHFPLLLAFLSHFLFPGPITLGRDASTIQYNTIWYSTPYKVQKCILKPGLVFTASGVIYIDVKRTE